MSSSDEEDEPERAKLVGRAKWLKRVPVKADQKDRATGSEQAAAEEERRRRKIQLAEDRRAELMREEAERRTREEAVVLTADHVERMISATVARMWKREANRRELVEQLRGHVSRAVPHGVRVLVPALMHLIAAHFENRSIDEFMPLDRWRVAVGDVNYLLRILAQHPDVRLVLISAEETVDVRGSTETVEDIMAEAGKIANGDAAVARSLAHAAQEARQKRFLASGLDPNVIPVVGDLTVFATRLAVE